MTIQFRPISEEAFEAVFLRMKDAIFEYVDAAFGWDDALQRTADFRVIACRRQRMRADERIKIRDSGE